MRAVVRILRAIPLILGSPLLMLIAVASIALTDVFWAIAGRRRMPGNTRPNTSAATVIVPNWNGRGLLDKYLPSVVAALGGNPDNEVIVVDNGSADGSAEFVRTRFPEVNLLALPENLGFGGGSNAGIAAARNDIVVLLNSDMRVAPDFLQPLLDGFTDAAVFSVSCQIFFTDPAKLREETGLTQGWWESGRLRVRHRADERITDPYPCFYGGGGSCAFDRRKFLELGGFDELLKPFYLEDTDLGYLAWKRGWKVLYAPKSVVYHEHRGTIGKKFSPAYIQSVLKKNFLLFAWKNIHDWRKLGSHFLYTWADALLSAIFGDSAERANLPGLWRAALQLPRALTSRWRARSLAIVDDSEVFRRPLGGYFRDRFQTLAPNPERLSVLFLSPYPICPPVHGGGVFMYQTTTELARWTDLHLIILLDKPEEWKAHDELAARCASAEFIVRMKGSRQEIGAVTPHAIEEFHNQDLEWLMHRQIYSKNVDVIQLEYLPMAQYAADFKQIPCILFEHDIYFQSIGRQLPNMKGAVRRAKARLEYLRAIRYELAILRKMDRIQVCSRDNREFLLRFLPQLDGRIDDDLRAGIDTTRYMFQPGHREPYTLLFLGSFRHVPNAEALDWFVRHVWPRLIQARPQTKLVVIGSDPPPRHSLPSAEGNIELHGFVEDILEPLRRYAVFICPILSGSGVRVKLLEAFAAGIAVVSTHIGAEGLADKDGEICGLADSPERFAERAIYFLDHPEEAAAMAVRAREEVTARRDMPAITRSLEQNYREAVREKRATL